ncbi:DNA-binding transcriptional activator of the SARP family [Nonomuraea solani]|uniref:DNA-binding transcriptional activator of the SARP family n=1 Tax=Nonomuraea solani TaxID=1144553 RepID=A0A1H5W053_9ACTN|nr:BTAD domain-containing putative transcriptional regulator [Nonomuraea solani]SEF92885.1 DNA-binding transcriptional activator of the SARP family [Nonomuraea solani]
MNDAHEVSFLILGPLEIHRGGRPAELTRPAVRRLLGLLLLRPGQVWPADRLLELVWEPGTAAYGTLHTTVSRLRRWLWQNLDMTDVLVRDGPGYRLDVPPALVDASRFMAALTKAASGEEPAADIDGLRAALRLWRGPVLDGCAEEWTSVLQDLERARVHATCLLADRALDLGKPELAMPFVTMTAEAWPYDEALQHRFIGLLNASGRRAEALRHYESVRTRLAHDLGVDPSPTLRQLHLDLLVERAPAVTSAAAPPVHLPPDLRDFTGRGEQTERLLGELGNGPHHTVVVSAITGGGGVGKTTLAVHAAHRLRAEFAGVLYADLRSGKRTPADPGAVLVTFLRDLGVEPAAVPPGTEERAELYRSLLAFRRVLIVLDDADTEEQVLPLLPGTSTCGVLVTSRYTLDRLPGALHLELREFSPAHALELLSRIIGRERAEAEPEAARELVRLCGHLPLAVRIAGARLSADPAATAADLVARLRDERLRLDELSHGALSIRASLAVGYRGLDERAARLLRLLGRLDSPDFTAATGAAALDCPVAEAQRVFDRLVRARLLEVEQGRYTMHDLIRAYARELADPADEAEEALGRVLTWSLTLARRAHRTQYGGDFVVLHGDVADWEPEPGLAAAVIADDPLGWADDERHNLVALARQAAATGRDELCWDLAVSLVSVFEVHWHHDEWRAVHAAALEATRAAGNRRGRAAVLTGLGYLLRYQHRYEEAARSLEAAVKLFGEVEEVYGLTLALVLAASTDAMRGRCHRALASYEQALAIVCAAGDVGTEILTLRSIAEVHLDLDQPEEAESRLLRAMALLDLHDSHRSHPQVLSRCGELRLLQGRPTEARPLFEWALRLARDDGSPYAEAHALHGLGLVRLAAGDTDRAKRTLREALVIAEKIRDGFVQARVLASLGECHLRAGEVERATAYLTEAALLSRRLGALPIEAKILTVLARAQSGSAEASGTASRARELSERIRVLG